MPHQRFRKGNTRDSYHFSELDFDASKAVRAGDLVFLQGQTGITLDGKGFVGEGDPAAQAENAMQCVKTLLDDAGASMEDICKITTYVTEHSYRALVYPVIARHLKGVHVVSTGLVIKELARPEIVFEIDVFAVVS
jgi:enamine deaminase RidA (YjgF/YER057c/UK114 family)